MNCFVKQHINCRRIYIRYYMSTILYGDCGISPIKRGLSLIYKIREKIQLYMLQCISEVKKMANIRLRILYQTIFKLLVNIKNNICTTPLFKAVITAILFRAPSSVFCANFLGADQTIPNNKKKLPLEVAIQDNIRELLLSYQYTTKKRT
jgi:hypothetical protein